MCEVIYAAIIYGAPETVETLIFNMPIPIRIVHNVSALDQQISSSSKVNDPNLRRYYVLLLESIGKDADDLYTKMEENPQILAIFNVWNEDFTPPVTQTKLYYIPKGLIDLVLSLTYIQSLKSEAEKNMKLNEISLSKIYLRKAEKTKELVMSNLRAEPCHILIIPLNTDSTNMINTIERIQQSCAKFGYPSVIVRLLDDYIPKNEIYDKLPYGKLMFEYEEPRIICRWLRLLSPIRMYLYGNEQIIPNEWSKEMVLNEPDNSVKRVVNCDDWCTFIENESINDDIKWNFSSRHGKLWQIKNLTPIKLDDLNDNLRFRSALRRSNITFQSRMSTTTAQIFDWFDECIEHGYLNREFQLVRQDKPTSINNEKSIRNLDIQPFRSARSEDISYSLTIINKEKSFRSLAYISNQSNEIYNYSNKSDRTYIWLDHNLQLTEQRFQSIISPNQWKHFSDAYECQTFILSQQLQNNPKIYLISSYHLAEQLFAYEHVSKIFVAYLYSNQNEIFSKWINNFPVIRGIYKNLDTLFEQIDFDITTNIELLPHHQKQQEIEDPLPISFYDTDQDGFRRHRVIIEILLKLPRTLEAKQEMIDELRRVSSDNDIFLKQIDDFEQNYHSNAAIQWYTRDSFLYRLINRALRYEDIELIIKYRFFIIDLYQKLDELHQQIIHLNNQSEPTISTYYRGQLIPSNEIDQFKKHVGSLVSINTFFSTTLSFDIALMFAGTSTPEGITKNKPVIFCIEVESSIKHTRPYANINSYSAHEDEDEVLFALGSVFSIEKVYTLTIYDTVQVIHLKMIDEKDLPQENISMDLSQLLPEQRFLNPIYALVGLTNLFQMNEQSEQIKSRLEDVDVQFFDNTEDLDNYTKTIKAIQSFVIFIHSQSHVPECYQQTKLISYSENDMHFNDLIYQLLYEMEHHHRPKEHIKDLYMNIANVYRPSNENIFYVQLLLSSPSRTDSEEQLRTKLPSSTPLITFYQTESCMNFLQSITEENKIGNAILLLQSDDANIDNIIDQFEPIDSIKFIYLCSKNALDIPYRRIIHGKFPTENDLYGQLYSDNMYNSFTQANQQIDLYKNKTEANRYFQQTEQFYKLLKEHQDREKNLVE